MSIFAKTSIRGKLMWITMLTSTGAVILACLAFGLYELLNYRHQITRNLSVLSQMISAEQGAGREISDPEVVKEVNSWARQQRPIVLACVYSKDGRLLIKYARDNNITQIMIGHSNKSRLGSMVREPLSTALVRELRTIDIHIVAAEQPKAEH